MSHVPFFFSLFNYSSNKPFDGSNLNFVYEKKQLYCSHQLDLTWIAIIIVLGFVNCSICHVTNMTSHFTLNDVFASEIYVFSMILDRHVINLYAWLILSWPVTFLTHIQIETRNNKLEMQSVNNKSLIEELDKLLERLRVPSEVLCWSVSFKKLDYLFEFGSLV